MRRSSVRISTLSVALLCAGLGACQSTDTPKPKKRAALPGEEVNELNWGRSTGPNDFASPLGLPMSR